MTKEIKKYLFDIKDSIEGIQNYAGVGRNFLDFQKNIMLKRAVERELEIIGEAMNRILKLDNSIQIEHARKIVDLRNFIIHTYEKIDDEILWGIIVKDIPKLREQIKQLLAQ